MEQRSPSLLKIAALLFFFAKNIIKGLTHRLLQFSVRRSVAFRIFRAEFFHRRGRKMRNFSNSFHSLNAPRAAGIKLIVCFFSLIQMFQFLERQSSPDGFDWPSEMNKLRIAVSSLTGREPTFCFCSSVLLPNFCLHRACSRRVGVWATGRVGSYKTGGSSLDYPQSVAAIHRFDISRRKSQQVFACFWF